MSRILSLSLASAPTILGAKGSPDIAWQSIQPGVEFSSIPVGRMASGQPGLFYVVRVDPARARLTVALASEERTAARTAAEWCRTSRLAVAINLGMFQGDQRSNVGYLRHGTHVNNPRWNSYKSVLAVNPSGHGRPLALWIDREQVGATQQLANYDTVVQSLRLITKDRRNVWAESGKRWSEAALAIDSKGRLLFLFSRAPYSMHEFNNLLLKLPLDISGVMHVEGGPEASLSIHTKTLNLDLAGSFETGFWPDDSNQKQWPIPNVIGVLRDE